MPMKKIQQRIAELGGLHSCLGPSAKGQLWPLSEGEVDSLESDLGIELPQELREFLMQYGGSCFRGIIRTRGADYYRVSQFYGGGVDTDRSGHIRDAMFEFQNRIPDSLLPFAECDDGAICIGVRGEEYGRVFYWDRWNEWDWRQQERILAGESLPREEQFQNVSELADSFEAFICGLEIVHLPD